MYAFAVACRRAGLEVLYLGSNVPLESWLRTVRETGVPAVVLGAVATVDSAGVSVVVDAIKTLDHPPTCFAGGPAALDTHSATGAVELPASLDEAVVVVLATVDRAKGTPRIA